MNLSYLFKHFYKTSVVHHSNLLFRRIVVALLLVVLSSNSLALPSYRALIIPTDDPSVAVAINDDRQVVGNVSAEDFADGSGGPDLVFLYHPIQGIRYLDSLGGSSYSFDINESGQVVGSSQLDGIGHAVLWDSVNGITDLTPSASEYAVASHISNTGIVVGEAYVPDPRRLKAFEWTEELGIQLSSFDPIGPFDRLTYLGVADNGTILVSLSENDVFTYYLSIPGQTDLPLGVFSLGSFFDPHERKTNVMNREGVAAGYSLASFESQFSLSFLADARTREIIDFHTEPLSSTIQDINEKLWMLYKGLFIPGLGAPFPIDSLVTEWNGVTGFTPRGINNHGDIVGDGYLASAADSRDTVAVILINENIELQPSRLVAQYRTDFANPPALGWLYQWNAGVPIGQSEGYVDMQWDRWKYDSDGLPGLPDASGLAYGYFSASGGHPGQSTSQGEANERHVIAGFEIKENGMYRINDSYVIHTGCENGNGGIVNIYVNDILINSFNFEQGAETSFDGIIGLVNAGSIIYVAVGPNGDDACDGFDWDYAIEMVGREMTLNLPPVIEAPGDQSSKIGDNIHLLISANDPEGENLSFEASRLPDGLSIDSESGLISGTISSIPGTFNVEVTVTDSQAKSARTSIRWVVNESNSVLARYTTDFEHPPANGWSYQWNFKTVIGQSNGYVNLQWARFRYDSDGVNELPDDSGLAYGHLDPQGGHPGRGTLQGEIDDRYVIAGFTIDTSGEYRIRDSRVINDGCSFGNGGIVKIYVGDKLIESNVFDSGGETSFDTTLGMVEAGDTIYVALGPNGKDGCDGFKWDFAIELI